MPDCVIVKARLAAKAIFAPVTVDTVNAILPVLVLLVVKPPVSVKVPE